MSSLPGYSLEDFVAWQWNLSVIDAPENNVSLGMAEFIGTVAPRPTVTKEQLAKVVSLYEPYRETIEDRLLDFDEEEQSWRSYAEHVDSDVTEEINEAAKQLVKELTCTTTGS
ncbi:hypothetical protein D9M68_18950 [compost metagenome]